MDFNKEALSSWETNASFWDDEVGVDGNKYWKRLQEPSLRRLLGSHINQDTRALDLATGNGLTARWLANEGCSFVLATDGTSNMLQQAKNRASKVAEKERIEYEQLDVTSVAAFQELLKDARTADGFDVVLMNMAIMDIADIEPLAQMLPKLLKPNGVFVANVLHPVFFTSQAARQIEVSDFEMSSTAKPPVERAKVIKQYLHVPPYRGVACYGQPVQQLYFHRPIHELFSVFFQAGLVMDGIEEPAFTPEDAVKERVEANANFTQLPAILAFRMRRRS